MDLQFSVPSKVLKEASTYTTSLLNTVHFLSVGLPEEKKVQTPAFTDTVRLYRQAQGHFGTWEMMCGVPSQVKPAQHITILL